MITTFSRLAETLTKLAVGLIYSFALGIISTNLNWQLSSSLFTIREGNL